MSTENRSHYLKRADGKASEKFSKHESSKSLLSARYEVLLWLCTFLLEGWEGAQCMLEGIN